jgi:hypothetical protein
LQFGLVCPIIFWKEKDKTLVLTQGPVIVLLIIQVIGKVPQTIRPFLSRDRLGQNRKVDKKNPAPTKSA